MLSDPVRKRTLLRDVNRRIHGVNSSLVEPSGPQLHCECARTDCTERVRVPREICDHVLAEVGTFIVAPGHELGDEQVLVGGATFCLVVPPPADPVCADRRASASLRACA